MKKLFIFVYLTIVFSVFSIIPDITPDNIILEKSDGGYDLYIKKLNGINSLLLTESQKDANLKITNYGLQTDKYYPANGDEDRILDGKILSTKYQTHFLVHTNTEIHPALGEVYHFFLPETVSFGYNWSRKGIVKIEPGINLNLRKFEKPYADYTGKWTDQWITFDIKFQESDFRSNLINNFKTYTDSIVIPQKIDDLNTLLINNISNKIEKDESADVIFILDTTDSMKEELPVFKESYKQIKENIKSKIKKIRIGLVLYKDYGDIYVTKLFPLDENTAYIDSVINGLIQYGGDDMPEAVNEAIYELNNFDYKSINRYAFLIGDAPAHPKPRGKITIEDALKTIKDKNIKLEMFCLPYK